MKLEELHAILKGLNQNEVRYLVAGGMAVVAHGYGRMTVDLDLVLHLDPDNIRRAFGALESMGYVPRVPITGEQFADQEMRAGWIRDKGMTVLNLWSDIHRSTPVDIFVEDPFDFDEAYRRAPEEIFEDGTRFKFVDLRTLLEMKRVAARDKDLDDIRHLEMLADERNVEDS